MKHPPIIAVPELGGASVTSPALPGQSPRGAEYTVYCHGDRPYFAEVPYFLWGPVDYASSGDARRPTDRDWRDLSVVNRETGAILEVAPVPQSGGRIVLAVRAVDPVLALRAAYFLTWRTDGQTTIGEDSPLETHVELAAQLGDWDYKTALARSVRVRKEFGRAELMPFDDGSFWPSWKWVGVPAVARTRVGRWIMDAVLRKDPRAVYLCVEWLRRGTASQAQTDALCYALGRFTGLDFPLPGNWITWYSTEGAPRYPRPDFNTWWAELDHD